MGHFHPHRNNSKHVFLTNPRFHSWTAAVTDIPKEHKVAFLSQHSGLSQLWSCPGLVLRSPSTSRHTQGSVSHHFPIFSSQTERFVEKVWHNPLHLPPSPGSFPLLFLCKYLFPFPGWISGARSCRVPSSLEDLSWWAQQSWLGNPPHSRGHKSGTRPCRITWRCVFISGGWSGCFSCSEILEESVPHSRVKAEGKQFQPTPLGKQHLWQEHPKAPESSSPSEEGVNLEGFFCWALKIFHPGQVSNSPRGCELCPGTKSLPDEDWEEKLLEMQHSLDLVLSLAHFWDKEQQGSNGVRNPPAPFAPAGVGPFHSTLAVPCDWNLKACSC